MYSGQEVILILSLVVLFVASVITAYTGNYTVYDKSSIHTFVAVVFNLGLFVSLSFAFINFRYQADRFKSDKLTDYKILFDNLENIGSCSESKLFFINDFYNLYADKYGHVYLAKKIITDEFTLRGIGTGTNL